MDCTEVKVIMAEDGQLEPLVIIEEGDAIEGVTEREAVTTEAVTVLSKNGESTTHKKEDGQLGEANSEDNMQRETYSEEQSHPKGQAETEEERGGRQDWGEGDGVFRAPEETENVKDGQDREDKEREGQIQEGMRIEEIPVTNKYTEQDMATPTGLQVDSNGLTSPDQPPEETQCPVDALKEAHRLTPDFPEALYELLCTLQERRLNDQRCSFRMQSGMRRRCHSEPNTTKPAHRVIFSSMTSLQTEEFFELVATSQARRLDDQRAEMLKIPPLKPKVSRLRGSLRQLTIVKKPAPIPAPIPVPKEDLYNMIRTTQAQGRLEDQRSTAPGPVDDEDFFSLLLRVQGGRMEEQRTELPHILQT